MTYFDIEKMELLIAEEEQRAAKWLSFEDVRVGDVYVSMTVAPIEVVVLSKQLRHVWTGSREERHLRFLFAHVGDGCVYDVTHPAHNKLEYYELAARIE